MKYGKHEFERTFLVNMDSLKQQQLITKKKITDKYIEGTTLRLRKVETTAGTVFKLTQKEKLLPDKPGILKINTLYLTALEFEKLNILTGVEIEKTRHIIEVNEIRIGIDIILIHQNNLYLAEIEFNTEQEMNAFIMPIDYIKEVTGVQKYSGHEIAKAYYRGQLKQ